MKNETAEARRRREVPSSLRPVRRSLETIQRESPRLRASAVRGLALRSRPPKGEGGFTLIELLLVIVIIGILAAIVVPKLTGRSEDARIGAAKGQITHFSSALATYEVDSGRYPSTDQGLLSLLIKPGGTHEPRNWKGPYLESKELPLDPWDRSYLYVCPGIRNPTGYDLWSVGPNGVDEGGTGDDIDKP